MPENKHIDLFTNTISRWQICAWKHVLIMSSAKTMVLVEMLFFPQSIEVGVAEQLKIALYNG